MKPMRRGWWMVMCVTILAVLPAAAAEKAVNLSLFTPISLAKPDDSVTAFRFSLIYGKNTSVGVVDVGFVNHTTTLSNGLMWGAVNYTEGAVGVEMGSAGAKKKPSKPKAAKVEEAPAEEKEAVEAE